MTDEERATIQALAEAATPGPWESPSPVGDMVLALGLNTKIADCERVTDAKFIAASRQAVPDLLAEVERLQRRLALIEQSGQKSTNMAIQAGKRAEIAQAWFNVREGELAKTREELLRYQTENATLREVVQAVASGQTRHVAEADRWVLAFDNPALSYVQTIWQKARALLGEGRSTPDSYADGVHVWDARGQLWCYSAPSDTWRMREEPTPAAMVSLTSARSYQRLVAEFGPLRTDDEGSTQDDG